MHVPFRLNPDDAERYIAIRREMLLDAPWAFLASADDDMSRDASAIAQRLGKDDNAIFGIEYTVHSPSPLPGSTVFDPEAQTRRELTEVSPGGRGSEALLAVAGIFREPRIKTRHRAVIWGVYTVPRARGNGYSRLVVSAAIDHARTWNGVDLVTLCVSERANEAHRLYESLGFVRWGSEPDAVRVGDESFTDHYMHLRLRGP